MKSLTELYTDETKETPFDHTGGYTYAFTSWVMKVAERAMLVGTAEVQMSLMDSFRKQYPAVTTADLQTFAIALTMVRGYLC